ncbi:S8 family peptidase [Crocinitomicaceae bacterium]|nr:S8 family peptidase [Crocinitomicaceae bacterium]
MKLCYSLLFLAMFALGTTSMAQDYTVNFHKGTRTFDANAKDFNSSTVNSQEIWQNKLYRFIQFNAIPTDAEKSTIEQSGLELLEYIPNYTYIASVPANITATQLTQLNIRSVYDIDDVYKIGQRIQDEEYPEWAVTKFGTVLLSIALFDNVNFEIAIAELENEGVRTNVILDHANMAFVEILPSDIQSLVDKPYMKYVDIMPDPGTPESDDGRNLHRANAIDGDYHGSRQYDGTGIAVAVNDDGAVGPHIDYTGRVNQDDVAGDFTGDHGDMVAGIVGAAGNLDPTMRGMAPACYMHIRQYVSSMAGTMPLHIDSNVLIFQSSYSNGCNAGYTNTTVLVDEEIYNNPTLIQVFSAGNSNNQNCGYGAGNQWGNITGGHKIGKNVIATANLDNDDGIVSSSSRGPANDGRIKPDIAAHGAGQMSTDPNNTYAAGGGTSAAAPGITGVLTQLHHAYEEMNGTTANSALLKATVMNTANDLGNEGPDFIYGWGKINGLKAVQLLEDGRYTSGSISQGGNDQVSISVPAGVEQVKVMVYWADKEASTTAATALVNDLDALLTDPNLATYQPWLLDHSPNATTLALPATVGADHLNNVEQIAIDNPMAGTYTLDIAGTTVPFGPQEYYVVWEFITDDIIVTYPFGGEGLIPGSNDRIHWDANGTSGDFALEYTDDNGASWNTIANNVNGADRIYEWNVPNIISGEVRVRVSRGGSQGESAANFSIMERTQNIEVYRVCESTNTVVLRWDPVPNATEYDVFMLGSQFMDSIGSSNIEEFDVIVSDVANPQWFTVRAVGANGLRSNRQIAIYFPGAGGNGNCVLSCFSDSDVGIAALTEPAASFQTCSGNVTSDVVIDLENIGLFTESNFPVYYQLDNGAVVNETYNGSLAPGGSATHTFATQITFPGSGAYELKTWTGLNGDSTTCNDTITQMINVASSISTFPLSEDFESGFPPATAEVINPDGSLTWTDVNTTGADGNATTASFINNFSYNAAGQEDELRFVNFDLSNVQNPATAILTFDVAYREYSGTYTDEMRIDVSGDCGQTFTQVYYKDGPTLATGANTTSNWEPSSAGDWRNDTIDMAAYIGGNAVVRFVNICGYGNNLFLDNINLEVQSFASLDELNNLDLTIMPNPANEETTIQFAQPLTEDTKVSVVSMDGRIVWEQTLSKGTQSKTINVNQWEAAVYTVRFASEEQRAIRKIVIRD